MGIFNRISSKMALIASVVVLAGFTLTNFISQHRLTSTLVDMERISSQVITGFVSQQLLNAVKFGKADKVEEEFVNLAKQTRGNLGMPWCLMLRRPFLLSLVSQARPVPRCRPRWGSICRN
ncbi:hypothetical protein RU080_04790 [Shewanella algae]|uniref:hypothetical protein n=1 Tax=Shewanella algae TaxID=38313 RepID=UPI00293681E6|nr:hypothetical protein [Shewanella algae]MDV2961052.1 hypothetical protein [Shewanella algae]